MLSRTGVISLCYWPKGGGGGHVFVPECLAGELLRELEVPLELAIAQAGRQDPRKWQTTGHRGEQGPDVSFLQVANIIKN